MTFKYLDVIDASKESNWRPQVKAYLDKGQQVVVFNLKAHETRDCKALAQEHDFTCIVEDKGEYLEILKANYPDVQPEILGFVHRDKTKRITN